jgi:TonB-linked SusC/RagA family outer membrane protein
MKLIMRKKMIVKKSTDCFKKTLLFVKVTALFFVMLLTASPVFGQDKKVTGRITSDAGEPLSGVSILVKGTTKGTTTDNNGNFTLVVPDNATLLVSAIGYEPQEIKVGGQTVLSLKLVQATKRIDEVVVIGYGSANKRDLTGSIVKISGKDVADKPNTNPIASLQSKVAGLSVVNNGTPGQAPDIRIRGTISIGSVRPLYVVDGIFNDNIDYINPNDIESIEILKDPSSLAIFGVRGAAGVIAVTTKKAKAGQLIINYNFSLGSKKLVDKIEWASASQFKELYDEERVNGGGSPLPASFYSTWNGNTDWVDAVTRVGHFNSHNLSVSGSTDKNKFTMGMGYVGDEGIIRHEKLEKILFSLNDEFKLSKSIRVGFNFNGVRQNNPFGYASRALSDARKAIPQAFAGTRTVFTKNPYGIDSLNQQLYYELPTFQNSGVVNPLIQLENEWNKTIDIEYRTVTSAFAEINFLRDFTLKSTVYADLGNRNTRDYNPTYYSFDLNDNKPFLVSPVTSVSESDNSYKNFQQDHVLTYKKKFGDHQLTALGGFTTYYTEYRSRSGSVQQSVTGSPIPDDKRFWYINNGFGLQSSQRASSEQSEKATVSGLFRMLYSYQNKYYLNASFRRDGSSQISPANRWQNFWAVGAGWEVSKENFMSNVRAINFLKLKASIGVLGNQNTYGFPYPFYPGLKPGLAAVFGDLLYNAYSQAYLPNPNLKWETVHAKDIGVELNAFSNRLHFEASYFDKVTKDLMTYIPGINGATDGLTNIGSVKNNGLEFSASWDQKLTKDLSVTVSGNLTTYKNKVLELATKDFAIIDGPSRTLVGAPIGSFYGYIVEGIYQSYADKLKSPVNADYSYGPGDFKYKDINGDGVVDSKNDRTVIGNPTPDFTYGGSITLNYKGFDLGVDFGGVYGNEVFRDWGGTEPSFQRVNYAAFMTDRWHGEGTSNWVPILGTDHLINNQYSTFSIEDGSYFRIRNLQIGYDLGKNALSNLKVIKNLRLFGNVQNLKTFKRNLGYTAEYGGSATRFGVDGSGGAIPVVATFGINVTF